MISLQIEIIGERNDPLRTKLDAELTSLAELLIDFNVSLQSHSPIHSERTSTYNKMIRQNVKLFLSVLEFPGFYGDYFGNLLIR